MKLISDFGCDYYAQVECFNKISEGYLSLEFNINHSYCITFDGVLYSYNIDIYINKNAYPYLSDATIQKIGERLLSGKSFPGFFMYEPHFCGCPASIMTENSHKSLHYEEFRNCRNFI